jgi:ABC-2 type transport system permease protein
MLSVYKKELRSYFTSLTGYVAIVLILVLSGIFIKIVSFDARFVFIENALPTASIVLMLAVPIIAMSSFAGEKTQKTDQLLYSLPVSTGGIVMGKYFAMLTVLSVPVLIMSFIPFILSMYGTVNYFSTYVGFLYFLLLIAAMLSICMFMSTVTESQVIAAVLGAGALIVCYFSVLLTSIVPKTESASLIACIVISVLIAGISYLFVKNYYVAIGVGAVLEAAVCIAYIIDSSVFLGLFGKMIDVIAIFDRFNLAVTSQMLDITTVAYYLSVSVFFCFLTGTAVEKRRYS